MMKIPYHNIEEFLQWTNETSQVHLNVVEHFPMSSKIFAHQKYSGPESGMLASFTTICPGAGKNKDPYWTITDAYKHLIEVIYIFKWLHRHNLTSTCAQPEMHVVFDGSSNHTARPFDALYVGGGLCKGPGGANAPGAPLKEKDGKKNGKNRVNMRDGWYVNKRGERVSQVMHRDKTWMDDRGKTNGAIFNAVDGLIFKGVEEILKESEECELLVACDGKPMPYRCNKVRRRYLKCMSDKICNRGMKCCMLNTLKWRPDFCEQKCKLEEVCESHGVKFLLLPICHPELNPIEGNL
jgi:hypothetical protein